MTRSPNRPSPAPCIDTITSLAGQVHVVGVDAAGARPDEGLAAGDLGLGVPATPPACSQTAASNVSRQPR